jgi:iron-sulfur cluster assembly accessory protein
MTLSVTLTERAAVRIKEIVAEDLSKPHLRVSVEGGGCSGFSYKFDLVSGADADDITLEREGATVLIDPVSLEYLSGSEIDFVDDLIGAAFRITNPNATSSCGCGTSFAM